MEILSKKIYDKPIRPVRIMQFGEGDLLRAFVDCVIQHLNDHGAIDSGVVAVQNSATGSINALRAQDGLYTLFMDGIERGEEVKKSVIIDVIDDCIDPYAEYERFLAYAESPVLQTIISDTTETGIYLDRADTDFTKCPQSFVGKLLAFLYRRYEAFNGDISKGLCIIPCELMLDNGSELFKCLTALATEKGYDNKFIYWLQTANKFTTTLADRISSGFPHGEYPSLCEKIGYIDNCAVKSELFHFWAIKKQAKIQRVFPADSTGLDVIFTDDVDIYRERKIKILNGTHTTLAAMGYLCGFNTVLEALDDTFLSEYIRDLIFKEIIQTVELDRQQTEEYALSILQRLRNPYISHNLLKISVNSTIKFRARLIPTLLDFFEKYGALPKRIIFALAALIAYHKGLRGEEIIPFDEEGECLDCWADIWQSFDGDYYALAYKVLAWDRLWGFNLNLLHGDITSLVAGYLRTIDTEGMNNALNDFINN